MSKLKLLISFLLLSAAMQAQTTDSLNTNISARKKLMVAALTLQQAATFYVEYKWWWEDNYHKFRFENDGAFNNYSLGVDKVGHFYTSYLYSNLLYETMKWSHFSEKSARTWSTVLPFAWALSIEIGDGFSKYAFSADDLLANSLGIAYAYAQKRFPDLKSVGFKFSYYPSSFYLNNGFNGWSLTRDYNGHIYWVTADLHQLLPRTMKSFWPAFLNLGVGYGIDNFSETDNKLIGYPLKREFFIGLDYNLSALNVKNQTLKSLLRMVDLYHFPAPGMKKTGGESWELKPLLLN